MSNSGKPLTCKIECMSCHHKGCYNQNLKYPFVCYHPDGVNRQIETIPYCKKKFIPPKGKPLKNCKKLKNIGV